MAAATQDSGPRRLLGQPQQQQQPPPRSHPSPGPEATPLRGYAPTSPSILDDSFDDAVPGPIWPPLEGTGIRTPTGAAPPTGPRPGPAAALFSSNNPYLAAIEARERAMTLAYLRSPGPSPQASDNGPADDRPAVPADDLGFGQHYQQRVVSVAAGPSSSSSPASSTTAVVVTTGARVPAALLSGTRECVVCAETLPAASFPALAVTRQCTHPPRACLTCVARSLQADLAARPWDGRGVVRCPECAAPLAYDDVQHYADPDTRDRYQALSFCTALAASPDFRWCPAGCGSGQAAGPGAARRPRMRCLLCGADMCFVHDGPWHEGLTCAEYDRLLADPEAFRADAASEDDFVVVGPDGEEEALPDDDGSSSSPSGNTGRTPQPRRPTRLSQAEAADRALARGLEAEELRRARERGRERARHDDEAREQKDKAERDGRMQRIDEMRRRAARRREEALLTEATVDRTTKRCPGCRWPIEKRDGCSHMTCTMCSYEFCYSCGLKWNSGCRNINCPEHQ